MNRFKFRVWDKNLKIFLPRDYKYTSDYSSPPNAPLIDIDGRLFCWASQHWGINNELLENPENYIIQQFTDLLDKNGKEIYEGDIVKSETNLFQVVYSKCGESASPLSGFVLLKINNQKVCLPCILKSQLEVIGNSRENPNLLDKNEKS